MADEAHDPTTSPSDQPEPGGGDGPQTTRLAPRWLFKSVLFLIVLFGLGFWGLADALYFYPKRGATDASLKLRNHLAAAQAVGKLTPSDLKVQGASLREELDTLRPREEELRRLAGGTDLFAKRQADLDLTRLEWLDSLRRMWDLDPDPKLVHDDGAQNRKVYFDPAAGEGFRVGPDGARQAVAPGELLSELTQKWTTATPATPLSGLDMLFQWVFVAVGFGGGLYLLIAFLRAAVKKFRWEPAEQRLTLPGGESIVPADLTDVDKRLWHKFYVTMILKDGRTRTLDLYRYVPLEDWVLAMERTAFPDRESRPPVGAAEQAAVSGNEGLATPNE